MAEIVNDVSVVWIWTSHLDQQRLSPSLGSPEHLHIIEPLFNSVAYRLCDIMDGNGSIDPIMAYYIKNEKGDRELYPAISHDQFAAQVPAIKVIFFIT